MDKPGSLVRGINKVGHHTCVENEHLLTQKQYKTILIQWTIFKVQNTSCLRHISGGKYHPQMSHIYFGESDRVPQLLLHVMRIQRLFPQNIRLVYG